MTKAERFQKRLAQMRKDGVSQSTLDTLKTEWETAQALPMEGTIRFAYHREQYIGVTPDIFAAIGLVDVGQDALTVRWKITKKNDGGRRLEITVPPETPKTPKKKG